MPLPIVPAPQTQIVLTSIFEIPCKDNVELLIGFSTVSLIFSKTKLIMESDHAAQTPATPSPGLFATKIPASAAFVLAVLLFFLPFAEVRCNGNAVVNNTGLGIAIGSPWKEVV